MSTFTVTDRRAKTGFKAGKRETVLPSSTEVLQALKAQEAESIRIEEKAAKIGSVEVKVRPLGDRMILKRLLGEEKQGLIIVPNPVREECEKGKVVAVGPGYPGEPTTTPVGATVMFAKHGITPIEIDGDEFLLCRESDLLAIE